jgi:hypothetical protein
MGKKGTYSNGGSRVVASTDSTADPVVETAGGRLDYILRKIRVLQLVGPGCYVLCCHFAT